MTGAPDALAFAVRALLDLRGADGLWGAFLMPPGESRDWVGAVAGLALAEASVCAHLPLPLRRSAGQAAAGALAVLLGHAGSWGYNDEAGPDADSTAAVVRLALALGVAPPASAVGFLARHGTPEDGYATYLPQRIWDRWTLPTTEVDCAAAVALARAGRLTPA
ncbi:MAG: hypothetical protein QM656_11460, partial [Paracoccaceae bacterium]